MGDVLEKAKKLAKKHLDDVKRLDGDSLYEHSYKIVQLLKDIGVENQDLLSATLFHDINMLHNQDEVLSIVKAELGNAIHDLLVNYLRATKLKINAKVNDENKDILIQTFISIADNLDVLLIMLADKTENSGSYHMLPFEKREYSANRGLHIYVPLCRFLGLAKYAKVIETNSFRTLYPKEYYEINAFIKKNELTKDIYLKNLSALIHEYLESNKIAAEISYRVKSPYSIFNKLIKYSKKLGVSSKIDDLTDIVAFRIIVQSIEDVYKSEDLLKKVWKEDLESRDDYITKPKLNGYQSLHTNFFIENNNLLEVQFRTSQMHEYNEFGNASHLFYKMGKIFKNKEIKNIDISKELKLSGDYKKLNLNQFNDHLYVFTPIGDIIEMPASATALDFAFEIHDDIGLRCKNAIVNDVIKKLSHKLSTGDVVKIIPSNKVNVNADMLEYVVTRKARTHIKQYLNAHGVFS